jgi:TPR repeat protein
MRQGLSIDECYRILELEPGASLAQIKAAWRLLSQIWHPDKHEPGSQAYKLAEKRQKELNSAYNQLVEYLQKQGEPRSTAGTRRGPSKTESSPQAQGRTQSGQDAQAAKEKQEGPRGRERGSLDKVRVLAQAFSKTPETMTSAELSQWMQKAKSGDQQAHYFMGLACEFGLGGNKIDYNNAAFWYERAVAGQNAAAMHRLGYLYLYGHGVSKNPPKGIRLWKDAAARGYEEAQLDLGMAYENGAWVEASLPEAKRFYAMAARSGNPVARQKLQD